MQSQAPRLTVLTTTRSVSGSAWQALASKLPLPSRLQSSLVTSVHRWAVDSQRSACRNAMVAGTALAVRRAEREEVEEFFAGRIPGPATEQDRLDDLQQEAPSAPDAQGHPGHTAHG
ncbi:MAG: hypothetical protein CMH84_13225 [Nocardioides sp.]|nr:hypothetical protein [Nocardioides sp.]